MLQENYQEGRSLTAKVEVKTNEDKKNTKCPCCSKIHVYKPRGNYDAKPRPSDRFVNCPDFRNLDVKSRGEMLENNKSCIFCTSWSHQKEDCGMPLGKIKCEEKLADGQSCTKKHNRLLHGCEIPYCTFAKTEVINAESPATSSFDKNEVDIHEGTLMLLQDLNVRGQKARVQFDTGSSRVLVTYEFAKRAGLKPIPVEYRMQVVNKKWETIKGSMYIFDLTKSNGEKMKIWGYGIDDITDAIPAIDLTEIRSTFPHVPEEAFVSLKEKKLDILIGLNFLSLHPSGGEGVNCVGNLCAMKSQFGCGWLIGGSDPRLKSSQVKLTAQALALVSVARVEVRPYEQKDLFEMDNLGILPAKRCNKCKNCKLCTDENLFMSCQEEEEFRLIDDSVTVKDGKTFCKWI